MGVRCREGAVTKSALVRLRPQETSSGDHKVKLCGVMWGDSPATEPLFPETPGHMKTGMSVGHDGRFQIGGRLLQAWLGVEV